MKLEIQRFGGRGAPSNSKTYKIPLKNLKSLKDREDKNYYVAEISPNDFLRITSTEDIIRNIEEETKEYGKLNLSKINNGYTMLQVDLENNRVVSHEGRHRAQLLKNNNYKTMQVVIMSKGNGYNETYAHDFNTFRIKHQIDTEKYETTLTNVKLINKKRKK